MTAPRHRTDTRFDWWMNGFLAGALLSLLLTPGFLGGGAEDRVRRSAIEGRIAALESARPREGEPYDPSEQIGSLQARLEEVAARIRELQTDDEGGDR
jgi:hypothetical protein